MERIKFDPKEMNISKTYLPDGPGRPASVQLCTPVSSRENFLAAVKGEDPLWIPHARELQIFNVPCVPDSWVRGAVSLDTPADPSKFGGKDMFGVEWEFVEKAGGSMVRPGNPAVKDLQHFEEQVSFPDVDSWDWEGAARDTEKLRSQGRPLKAALMIGFFERLVSFVDMENALVAMIDEDEKEHVHRLFDRLCGVYDRIMARFEEYFHPDMVWFHDDWGSQRAPMFSYETVEEMVLPYIKRMVDSAHSHGMLFEMHSCGKIESLVPLMVEAGCDSWDGQAINDKIALAAEFGDRMMFNIYLPALPKDATEEDVKAAARSVIEKLKGRRVYFGNNRIAHPYEFQAVYEESRKLLNP